MLDFSETALNAIWEGEGPPLARVAGGGPIGAYTKSGSIAPVGTLFACLTNRPECLSDDFYHVHGLFRRHLFARPRVGR